MITLFLMGVSFMLGCFTVAPYSVFLMGVSFMLGCFAVAPYSIIYEEKMRKRIEREKLAKKFSEELRKLGY